MNTISAFGKKKKGSISSGFQFSRASKVVHKSFLSFPFSCLFGHDKKDKLRWIWELRNKMGKRWSYKDIKEGGDEEEELHCSILKC